MALPAKLTTNEGGIKIAINAFILELMPDVHDALLWVGKATPEPAILFCQAPKRVNNARPCS